MRRPEEGSGGTGWLRLSVLLNEMLGSVANEADAAMECC